MRQPELFDVMNGDAVISGCGKYRYQLTRRWSDCGPDAVFIMLNPSTADGYKNDATIRRCVGFAKSFGCGGLSVVNLFAYRATSPADMKAAADPVGPDNELQFKSAVYAATEVESPGPVICAWGNNGAHLGQDKVALGWLCDMKVPPTALRVTGAGQPEHPLRLPKILTPQPYPIKGAALS